MVDSSPETDQPCVRTQRICCSAVHGVVEIWLDQLAGVRGAPFGARVRVHLGGERWPALPDLNLLAGLVYGAADIEVAGTSATAVAETVHYLRARLAELAS